MRIRLIIDIGMTLLLPLLMANSLIGEMFHEIIGTLIFILDYRAEAGAFLLGEHAGFITGTDLLIDGGVIASIRTGQYKLH